MLGDQLSSMLLMCIILWLMLQTFGGDVNGFFTNTDTGVCLARTRTEVPIASFGLRFFRCTPWTWWLQAISTTFLSLSLEFDLMQCKNESFTFPGASTESELKLDVALTYVLHISYCVLQIYPWNWNLIFLGLDFFSCRVLVLNWLKELDWASCRKIFLLPSSVSPICSSLLLLGLGGLFISVERRWFGSRKPHVIIIIYLPLVFILREIIISLWLSNLFNLKG